MPRTTPYRRVTAIKDKFVDEARQTMKRTVVVSSILCLILTVLVAFAIYRSNTGVMVVITNAGDTPMQDVVVHVTGNAYESGTIAPGAEDRVRVEPSGESHVEISFADENRTQQRLVADCYFEPRHYHGTIKIAISGDEIIEVEDAVSIGIY